MPPWLRRVEAFTAVRPRGSVQHLASGVRGRLRPDAGPCDAFASLFPAITATGVCKRAALRALARPERGQGGAVRRCRVPRKRRGALDAALALRTLIGARNEVWLRAGAGVTGQSGPERETEETCEKLRSVAPFLSFAES
ncbi:chorismate-binding protein [Streptomyces sp. SRF1]|uniref:chorismate-binding protein n=1 Tax=Streptomyces sp. SRF1 TaxID=1549642 RepID=UPI0025B1D7F6|nr:chorismate-binding protein [Streptomyces sp. SRF1]MDN3058502.1 chorismate-binding protein [Streptomyces sp. SRF1]